MTGLDDCYYRITHCYVFTGVCLSMGGGWHAWQGVCVGGMHGRGHAWWGACVAGGACMARGACVAGGACMARGACILGGMCGKGGCACQTVQDTVNEWAVCILLEYILVWDTVVCVGREGGAIHTEQRRKRTFSVSPALII